MCVVLEFFTESLKISEGVDIFIFLFWLAGGAHDAEYVSEEEVNTSSDIEHIEEGELADQGPGVVPGSPTPGEGESEGVGENEAVDNRNIPPVVHNTSGTCVDICPEDVMGMIKHLSAAEFLIFKLVMFYWLKMYIR